MLLQPCCFLLQPRQIAILLPPPCATPRRRRHAVLLLLAPRDAAVAATAAVAVLIRRCRCFFSERCQAACCRFASRFLPPAFTPLLMIFLPARYFRQRRFTRRFSSAAASLPPPPARHGRCFRRVAASAVDCIALLAIFRQPAAFESITGWRE